jgi:hypothetical protein
MGAVAALILAHPIVSVWLAAMLAAWLFLYAASRASDGPDLGSHV